MSNETVFFAAAAAIAVVAVVAVAAASEIEGHSRDLVQLVMEIEIMCAIDRACP